MRLLSVVMGAENANARISQTQSLLNYGFRFYETVRLFAAGDVLKESRVWKGNTENVSMGLASDLYITIPRGEYNNLQPVMNVKRSITAPVGKHEVMGSVVVQLKGNVLHEEPLLALDAVDRGNIFQRFIDHLLQMLE
jgi:D-alanyl-D-alanine carboxypeptidase (penicillin-binding protein 5/6)